jgi:predicted DNA-binding transcriptional regulator YafY
VRVSPQMHVDLPLYLGEHVADKLDQDWEECSPAVAAADATWLPRTLQFDSLEEARTKLLGLGAGVEVMTPVALRRSLLDYAQQVVNRYSRH